MAASQRMSRNLADRLADLIYPRKCVFCHRIMTQEPGVVCERCRKSLPPAPDFRNRGEFYKRGVGVFAYTDDVRDSILRFKFSGCAFYADVYGKLLAKTVSEELAGKYDLITFVPISFQRRFTRGSDQAELLAKALGKELRQPVLRTSWKKRNTGRQSRLSGLAERRANIQNAFRPYRPARWAGKRLLLIDDVLTTGATVSEVSRVLLSHGAAEVYCAFLAVTPNK